VLVRHRALCSPSPARDLGSGRAGRSRQQASPAELRERDDEVCAKHRTDCAN
jgi:hypothetical protein